MVCDVKLVHIYHYPIEKVVRTHIHKYPTEKEENVVKMQEVAQHTESDGVHYSKRIATITNVLPRLLQKLLFLDMPFVYLEEEIWQDWRARRCWTQSKNLTFAEHASVKEFSKFCPCPLNPAWTKFEQTGEIQVWGLGRAGYLLELFVKKFVDHNILKSVTVMEELLEESSRV